MIGEIGYRVTGGLRTLFEARLAERLPVVSWEDFSLADLKWRNIPGKKARK